MAEELDQSLLVPDPDAPGAPRVSAFTETGVSGISVVNNSVLEEKDSRWRLPQLVSTVKDMKQDSAVAIALSLLKTTLLRRKWKVEPPVGASPEQKEKAKFVQSCMYDLDNNTSWYSVVRSFTSFFDYGFCPAEIVLKRRLKGNSKYDDGLIGVAALPVLHQNTIKGWKFNPRRTLVEKIIQSTDNLSYSTPENTFKSEIEIDMRKVLLFRNDPINNNPEGTSILKAAWIPWRAKREMENQELIGASRELTGLLKMTMPGEYMSPNATDAQKAQFDNQKKVAQNIALGEQSALILPSDVNLETKTKMFDVDLIASSGARAFDTSKIIERLQSQILVALMADVLALGTTNTGSLSLAEGKLSVLEAFIDDKAKEIEEVLNTKLIPLLFQYNGWSDTDYPRFVSEGDGLSADELSKLIQRVSSVSALEIDRPVLNRIRQLIGVELYPDDVEPQEQYLPSKVASRSGDGMGVGKTPGNGTSDNVAGQDNSISNNENS